MVSGYGHIVSEDNNFKSQFFFSYFVCIHVTRGYPWNGLAFDAAQSKLHSVVVFNNDYSLAHTCS